MSGLLPVAVYGLKVPAGDVMIPAVVDFPATFRITMAAIDPNATPEHTGTINDDAPARATLKIVYKLSDPKDDDEDSDEEEDYLQALLEARDDDEDEDGEESSDDEEKNGGPSDPSKSKKAREEAAVQKMLEALKQAVSDDSEKEMDVDGAPKLNGLATKSKLDKGKGKALAEELDDDESVGEDDTLEMNDMEELVVCTLDPAKNYQQPLDLTIPEGQRTFFKVSGTNAIYLTGNYVIAADSGHKHRVSSYDDDEDDEEDEYDMPPDEDELDGSDDLDDLEDPRIIDLASEDGAEPPKLMKKDEPTKKGKNKRGAEFIEEEPAAASLDDTLAKSLKPAEPAMNGEPKLSKKQLKKLKNNAGKAVEAAVENKDVKKEETIKDDSEVKGDKKVKFAKNPVEQGPQSSSSTLEADTKGDAKAESRKADGKPQASLSVKMIQGVKVDDKKLGKGPAAKKGDKVAMRYIGKLSDGKVFDANKKGKPFDFKLGQGDVIKGWDIGVAGMSAGGERRIVVPANLAYGNKDMPGIPRNSELTFDVKMLNIN